jgi:hypothetical protein
MVACEYHLLLEINQVYGLVAQATAYVNSHQRMEAFLRTSRSIELLEQAVLTEQVFGLLVIFQ